MVRHLRSTLHWDADVVICDQSDDEGKALRNLLAQSEVKGVNHFYSPKRGASAARNEGAKYAQRGWIVFNDDDVRPAPDFLDRVAEVVEANPWVDALTTKIIQSDSATSLARSAEGYYYDRDVVNGKWRHEFQPTMDPVTRFMQPPQCNFNALSIGIRTGLFAVRAEAFVGVGGFDENMMNGEDRELGLRMWWYGYRVYFAAHAVSFHSVEREGGNRNGPALAETATRISPLVSMLYLHLKWFPGVAYGDYVRRTFWRLLLSKRGLPRPDAIGGLLDLFRAIKRARELLRRGPVYLNEPRPRGCDDRRPRRHGRDPDVALHQALLT